MSRKSGRLWTRDELILAINLYCKTPFGRIHVRNPQIIALAEALDRTPGSVSYKLANFAAIDPSLDRKGASNTSKLDRVVWAEFFEDWDSMILESEERLSRLRHAELPTVIASDQITSREGKVRLRLKQSFFRQAVLTSYSVSCCITGIQNQELLNASHIVPWSVDERNRLNPRNGLCLNALHDRAFDRGLISLDSQFRVLVSRRADHELLLKYRGSRIVLPDRFRPDPTFLEYHRDVVFQD